MVKIGDFLITYSYLKPLFKQLVIYFFVLFLKFIFFFFSLELKIQPALNSVLVPLHLRGPGGPMSGMNAASPSQDSSATGSPNSAGGAAEGSAAGHIHPPPDVCSSTAAGETLGAVGTA